MFCVYCPKYFGITDWLICWVSYELNLHYIQSHVLNCIPDLGFRFWPHNQSPGTNCYFTSHPRTPLLWKFAPGKCQRRTSSVISLINWSKQTQWACFSPELKSPPGQKLSVRLWIRALSWNRRPSKNERECGAISFYHLWWTGTAVIFGRIEKGLQIRRNAVPRQVGPLDVSATCAAPLPPAPLKALWAEGSAGSQPTPPVLMCFQRG